MSEEENKTADFETIRRAFAVYGGFGDAPNGTLWWRTDPEYAPITLFVNCNDLFYWGCSDCENLHPGNIGELEQAVKDAVAADEDGGGAIADILFCCRVRKMRPQGAYYKHLPEKTWPLFDACGPERKAQNGNPKSRPVAQAQ